MWVWALVSCAIAGYFILSRRRRSKSQMDLQKPNFKKDVVYIVQFPVSPSIRSISPFALKLETYLRLKKVAYEPVYSLKFGRKGQIPYIELNGEQIPDSNMIINDLESRGIAASDELTETQKAVAHLATVTVENHTAIAGFHWRYGYNMPEFYQKLCEPFYGGGRSLSFFRYFQPYAMIMKTKMHGLGRHSLPEIAQFSFKDLKALSVLLGDKEFFNGSDPTAVDCTLFGHLVQFLYMPLDIPQKAYIQEECPNLANFVNRMRDKFWPDWEEMCRGSCMDGKRVPING